VLKACIAANKIIIMQAANPGLTGGSTPKGSDYDRYPYRLFDQTSRLNEGQRVSDSVPYRMGTPSRLRQRAPSARRRSPRLPLSYRPQRWRLRCSPSCRQKYSDRCVII